ncbi:MAG: hypothetical protein ABFS35_00845 [Bacteroidota bacterium]
MKIISIILLSIFSVLNFQTENYYIIKIKGEIYNETSGKSLKQGDAIKAEDKLKFTQKNAVALVISDTRGRFILKYPERVEESVDALTVFVKNALVANVQNRLSTRSVATQSAINHLDNYLGRDEFNIIGDELIVMLSEKSYSISRGNDIIARYYLNNRKYGKELSMKNQTMVLSRSKFELPVSEEVCLEKVDIYKINASVGEENLITTIDLRFIVKDELEKEFMTIIEKFNNGQTSNSKIRSLLLNYFMEFYGKTDDFYLNQYVTQLINDNVN